MQDVQFELDMAKLDLKGLRFAEAGDKYLDIVKKYPNNSFAWCGLGVSKYGQLLDSNITIDEIFFCFEKAKEFNSDKASIELFVIENSSDMIQALYKNYINTLSTADELKKQKALGLVLTFVGGVMGGAANTNNDRTHSIYGDFLAIGGTIAGYDKYQQAKNDQKNLAWYQDKILSSIRFIRTHTNLFIVGQDKKSIEFNELAKKIQDSISDLSNTNTQSKFIESSNVEGEKNTKEIKKIKLISKSKNYKILGIVFIAFALGSSINIKDDPQMIIGSLFWLIIGILSIVKSRKLKKEVENLEYEV